MAGRPNVIIIQFRIMDAVQDIDRGREEARPSLFLKLQIGEGFRGPVNEVLSQQEVVVAKTLSAMVAQRVIGEGVVSDSRDVIDRRELPGEVRSPEWRGDNAVGQSFAHPSAFFGGPCGRLPRRWG